MSNFTGDQCVGCGIFATQQPVAAIMTEDDGKTFIERGICALCHQDPSHRQTVVKASYFIRGVHNVAQALNMAGERDKNGDPTPTQPGIMRRVAEKLGL